MLEAWEKVEEWGVQWFRSFGVFEPPPAEMPQIQIPCGRNGLTARCLHVHISKQRIPDIPASSEHPRKQNLKEYVLCPRCPKPWVDF